MNDTGNPGKEMDRAEHPGKDSDNRVTLTTTMGLQQETCEVNFSHPDNTSTSQGSTLGPFLVPRSFTPVQGVEKHVVKQTGETRYMCEVCGSRTARKCNLALHKRTDTEEISFKSDQDDYSEAQKGRLDNHRTAKTSVDKPFMCVECGYRTINNFLLAQHMRTHTGEKPYGCDLCDYSAGVKASLKHHIMAKHIVEKPYMCGECGYKTADRSYYNKHMKRHTGEKVSPRKKTHKCDKCDYLALRKYQLDRHIISKHTGEKPYRCDKCVLRTASHSHLSRHMRKHENPYKCHQCDYCTARKYELDRHISTKHTMEKPYLCEECGYRTAYRSCLTVHKITHTGEKPFMCEKCGYRTVGWSQLSQHIRTHTGEKPYKCDQCDYSAAQKCSLDMHLTKHAGEKPYKCEECGYRTNRKRDLVRHMRTHTGEKPYGCDLCDYSAGAKASLKRHVMVIHTGEKPYMCGECGYRTADSSHYSSHMKKHSGEKVSQRKKKT